MRILFAGSPEPATVALEALLAAPKHQVVGVLTRPDTVAGRGRRATSSAVAQQAEQAGLPILRPRSLTDPAVRDQLADLAIDCVAVVAYGALIPADLLALPPHGWVNLHFSLLPAWRGAAPVQHAIWAGDEFTGASTFQIERGLDTGPIYGVTTERIQPRDTTGTLMARLASSGATLLLATLDAIEDGSARPQPQACEGISHAPRISTEQARVDLTMPAMAIDRQIRAMDPAPGAWTTFRGQRLKLGPVTVTDTPLAAGTIHAGKNEVMVGTGSTAITLGRLAPAGKSWMPASAWARGARIEASERLGDL